LSRLRVRFGNGETEDHDVEHARAYRDRLVMKLAGVDDVERAGRFRGADLIVDLADAPALPEGEYWLDDLLGRTVVDENDEILGTVDDIAETGGGEVLVVGGGRGDGDEILIPLVRVFVQGVEEDTGRLRVRIPDDLRDLNRDRSV
jgi:16S rRNA processing protein RimM